MKAELIAVGTELLTGQIVNTNAQFLSEKFAELGIDVYFHTAVGDNEVRLLSVLEIASKRSDLVVLCGGLGPTEDDLTKQTLARFLQRELVFDDTASEKLNRFFASRPGRIRTPNNERQAQVVKGSLPLQNPTGLAVGSLVEEAGVTYVVLPGPPSELKAMFTESLQPLLTQHQQKLYSRVLRFFGIGESQLVTILSDVIANQTDPTLAPYAKVGEVTLRLSTKADTAASAKEKLDALEKTILAREGLQEKCYGYGEENSLVKVVAERLISRGESLAIWEELTGGLLQAELSLALHQTIFYKGGQIGREQEASETRAREVAARIRQQVGADWGWSVVGTRQPHSQEDNALAMVSIGWASKEKTGAVTVQLGGYSWQHLRQIACLQVLDTMRNTL